MFALGMWWLVLGVFLRRFYRAVRVAFQPFADWFDHRHALRVALAGLVVAAGSGAVLVAVIKWG
jgi:hypothetical protein